MQSRTLLHLVEKGLKLRQKGHTWDSISLALNILTNDGRLNPGLAKRIIADGYEPRRFETNKRLGLPIICPACDRRLVKRERHIPAWLDQAVTNLRELETKAAPLLLLVLLILAIHQLPHTVYHPGNCPMIFFPLASNCGDR